MCDHCYSHDACSCGGKGFCSDHRRRCLGIVFARLFDPLDPGSTQTVSLCGCLRQPDVLPVEELPDGEIQECQEVHAQKAQSNIKPGAAEGHDIQEAPFCESLTMAWAMTTSPFHPGVVHHDIYSPPAAVSEPDDESRSTQPSQGLSFGPHKLLPSGQQRLLRWTAVQPMAVCCGHRSTRGTGATALSFVCRRGHHNDPEYHTFRPELLPT